MRVLDPAWPPIDSRSTTSASQPLRRCVDRSCEAGRPRSDDHDVERPGSASSVCIARAVLRKVLAPADRPGPNRPGAARRGLRALLAARAEKLHALVRVGSVRSVRDAVPREQVPQLVAAGRPRIGDHRQLASAGCVLAAPLLQELGDEPVEELVGRAARLERVVVDVPECHRAGSRSAVSSSAQPPQGISSARFACGCRSCTRASSSSPAIPPCRARRARSRLPRPARAAPRAGRARHRSTGRRSTR